MIGAKATWRPPPHVVGVGANDSSGGSRPREAASPWTSYNPLASGPETESRGVPPVPQTQTDPQSQGWLADLADAPLGGSANVQRLDDDLSHGGPAYSLGLPSSSDVGYALGMDQPTQDRWAYAAQTLPVGGVNMPPEGELDDLHQALRGATGVRRVEDPFAFHPDIDGTNFGRREGRFSNASLWVHPDGTAYIVPNHEMSGQEIGTALGQRNIRDGTQAGLQNGLVRVYTSGEFQGAGDFGNSPAGLSLQFGPRPTHNQMRTVGALARGVVSPRDIGWEGPQDMGGYGYGFGNLMRQLYPLGEGRDSGVGVGADANNDGYDDDTGEPNWLHTASGALSLVNPAQQGYGMLKAGWDAGAQAAASVPAVWEQSKPLGVLQATGVPFAAAAGAVEYPVGEAVGAMQTAGQFMGNDPHGITPEGRLPQFDLPPPGDPSFSGSQHVDLNQIYQPLDTPERPKVMPGVSGPGDISDPAQAMQRYKAVTPPLLGAAVDMLAGTAGFGTAAKGLQVGAEAATGLPQIRNLPIIGADYMSTRQSAIHPFGATGERFANAVDTWAKTTPAQTISKIAAVGSTLGGGYVMGRAGYEHNLPENPGPLDYVMGVGLPAVAGMGLGLGAYFGGRAVLSIARTGAFTDLPMEGASFPADLNAAIRDHRAAIRAGRNTPNVLSYNGGWAGLVKAKLAGEFSSDKAMLEELQGGQVYRRTRGLSAKDAATQLHGVQSEITRMNAEHGLLAEQQAKAVNTASTHKIALNRAQAALDAEKEKVAVVRRDADVKADPDVQAAKVTLDQARRDLSAAKKIRKAGGVMKTSKAGAQEQAVRAAENTYSHAVEAAKDAHPDVVSANAGLAGPQAAYDATARISQDAENVVSGLHNQRVEKQNLLAQLTERETNLNTALENTPHTWRERFAYVSQLLAGIDRVREDNQNRIRVNVLTKRTVNDKPLTFNPDGTSLSWEDPSRVDPATGQPVSYEIGLDKGEMGNGGAFNLYMRLKAVQQRAEQGSITLMRDFNPKTGKLEIVPGGAVFTKADADARMAQYVEHFLGETPGASPTFDRYENTLTALTREHNAVLDHLVDAQVLTPQDAFNMRQKVLSYINVDQVDKMLHDWRNGRIPQDRRMFAASQGVEALSGDDGLLSVGLDQNLERDDRLLTLAMLNRNGHSLIEASRRDPNFNTYFNRYVLPEEADLAVLEREIEGEPYSREHDPVTGLPRGANPTQATPGLRQRHENRSNDLTVAQAAHDKATGALDRAQNLILKHAQRLQQREADVNAFVTANGAHPSSPADIATLNTLRKRVYQTRSVVKKANTKAAAARSVRDAHARIVAQMAPQVDEAAVRLEAARKTLSEQKTSLRERASSSMHEITTSADGKRAIWPVLVNGEWVPYETDRWLWELGSGLSEQQFPAIMGLFAKHVSGWQRAAVTSYSPSFIASNPIRDFATAFKNYPHPGAFLAHYLPAWADAWGTALDPAIINVLGALKDTPATRLADIHPTQLRASLDAAAGKARMEGAIRRAAHRMTAEPEEGGRFSRAAGRHGGAMGTLGENLVGSTPRRSEYGLGDWIDAPFAAFRALQTLSETPTRTAIYMAEHERLGIREIASRTKAYRDVVGPLSPEQQADLAGLKTDLWTKRSEAAYNYRTITTDFSRAGNSMRFLNSFMPLLNARVQGNLQTWRSIQDDPKGYVERLTAQGILPYLMSYAWNRSQFSDQYDAINDATKDRNAVIITHTYVDSRDGMEKPAYFKMPMDDVTSMATMLMRQVLDGEYHATGPDGSPLTPEQRNSRPLIQTLNAIIAQWLPNNPRPDQLDPGGMLQASVGMIPIVGVSSQMWANQEQFTGQPIYDPIAGTVMDDLQYATAPQGQSLLGIWGAQRLHDLGIKGASTSPAGVDFMIRNGLGSIGQAPWAYGIDQMLKTVGWQPPVALTAQDLGVSPDVPEAAYAKYLNWKQENDPRPLLARVFPRFFGAGGGAQAILAKTRAESPEAYARWQQTLAYMQAQDAFTQTDYQKLRTKVFDAPDPSWTNSRVLSEGQDLNTQRKGYQAALKARFPGAITDPLERQKFIASLPGVPVGADEATAMMGLPPGTDIQALASRYWLPPGVNLALLNPLEQEQARSQELKKIAAELTTQGGAPVSPQTVRAAVTAAQNGLSFPSLPVPETYREDWLNRYMAPDVPPAIANQYGTTDLKSLPTPIQAALRRAELGNIVRDQNLIQYFQGQGLIQPDDPHPDIAAQDILLNGVIKPGLLPIGPQYPAEQEMNRAMWLSSRIHDPGHFAPYMDQNGTTVGDENLWHQWDQQLAAAQVQQPNKRRWTPLLKTLDRMRSWANVTKINALYSDPDYLSYARFFGVGRDLTPAQWDQVKSGQVPRYVNPTSGQALDAQQQFQVDHVLSLYAALPDGPEKRKLQRSVRYIRKRMTIPAWRNIAQLDDIQPDALRSIDETVRQLDTGAQDEQDQELQQ